MLLKSVALLLAFTAQSGLAVPLLGGVTGALPGLTGTHVVGSATGIGSTNGNTNQDSVTGSNPAGAQSDVTDQVGPVLNTIRQAGEPITSVPASISANCSNTMQKCTVAVSGKLNDLLTDGDQYSGNTTISAWMKDGHGYGSAQLAGTAPLPFHITCDPTGKACDGTMAGNITQIFSNGKSLALWGWLMPSGTCTSGICTGSLSACGDPGYKVKRGDLC